MYSVADISQHLEQILTALRPLVESRALSINDPTRENTSDNACGAIGRIILATPHLVPLAHVLPVFITGLPLVKDFLEYAPVVEALLMVVRDNLAEVNLTWLLGFLADTCGDYERKTLVLTGEFLSRMASLNGESWNSLLASIGAEKAEKLKALVSPQQH